MRRSIRNQILVPLVAIQGAAIVATSGASAVLAARRSEREIVDRLDGVIATLGRSNFPHTAGVLGQMRGLSGAHFVALDGEGRVAGATLPLDAPPRLGPDAAVGGIGALGMAPAIAIGGERYHAAAVPTRAGRLLVLYPLASWRQARQEAALPPLLLGGAALVLMAGVTGWISHRIAGRVRRVERRVALVARGDFEAIAVRPGGDEVDDLVRSVNQMCAELREMRDAARRSERSRLLGQLAAGLAHQLRNALAGARLSVQLHARRSPPSPGDRTLEVALRQLAMTEEQVKGLLSLGRAEVGPPVPVDPARLLDEVALLLEPTCAHAGVTLEVVADGTAPRPLPAEADGLRAAVLNLAINAVEAAGAGGRVELLTVDETGGEALAIEVCDTGPGPPPELAASLFDPFVTGKAEGVGLGLALARQVAERHGGRLAWDRDGGRTRFRLTIARSPATALESLK